MIGATWFCRAKDPTIAARTSHGVQAFLEAVTRPRERARSKELMPLWSPNIYHDDATKRGNEGVAVMTALVLDHDAGQVTPEQACKPWQAFAHAWAISWSWTPDVPKFRVIVPLQEPIARKDWPRAWQWAASRAPDVDQQCKDAARGYYVPCPTVDGVFERGMQADAPVLRLVLPPPPPPFRPRRTLPQPHREKGWRVWSLNERIALGEARGRLAGGVARGVSCLQCGRKDAWFWLDETKARRWYCGHRKTCGATGWLDDLQPLRERVSPVAEPRREAVLHACAGAARA